MKVIGIVGRAYYNRDNQKIIQLNEDVRMALSKYDDVVSIVILPTNDNYYVDVEMGKDIIGDIDKRKLDCILDQCDGFIVPGGTYWYNFDEYVVNYAIRSNKSLLAICAGFQCMCSMFAKDRIKFDMTEKVGNDSHHTDGSKYNHEVIISDNTRLRKILGKDKILVNSVHNDCVNFEMSDLLVSAVSDDGLIEAVERVDSNFILGVQWHPEYLMDDNSIKIFDSFIDSIKK